MVQWLKNAVFYEIYPQSFCDSNGDGIGDFNGISEKLDYIKDLGFTAIWMNPCFQSPFYDAGYDVEDYYTAAPRYGTNEDLKRLFEKVHENGMHLILDLVPGHTSIKHPWFIESMKAQKNEFSDRYIWTNHIGADCSGYPGIAGSLRGISARNGSCAVNYYSSQPALNYGFAKITEPWQLPVDSEAAVATRGELVKIMKFWLRMGCDGFRVDMAGSLIKADEDQKETVKLWQTVLGEVKKDFPDAAFVSEWSEPDKSLLGGFDMDFLLHFGPSHYIDLFRGEHPYFSQKGEGSLKEFFSYYMGCLEKTQGKGLICLPSGNHDMVRMAETLCDTERKLAFAFMMTMPGVPFVYYGDEIGMRYLGDLESVEGGYGRTGSRTPMQWSADEVNCGFSAAAADKLYLALDPSDDRPTAAAQLSDDDSLLNEVKRLISIRKQHAALQESGAFELISKDTDYPLVYCRQSDDEKILVAINPTGKKERVSLNAAGEVFYSIGNAAKMSGTDLLIPPCSATFMKLF